MDKKIIKFWSKGCGNCKAITPILDEVSKEYKDIAFEDMDTANAEGAVEKYGITTLPTLVFFVKGQVVGKLTGLKPKSLIIKKIAEVF